MCWTLGLWKGEEEGEGEKEEGEGGKEEGKGEED